MNEDFKNLLSNAKNICLIPSQEPEALAASLALFYTLRELHKNVNVTNETLPKNLAFLVPSLDFISFPKDMVISIPKTAADVSQVYYEKNDDALKIHLTLAGGMLKKEDVQLYFTQTKPDVVITLGIQNFQQELEKKLDSFGFLLGAPIVNLDNHPENVAFGKVNIVEHKSLAELVLGIFKDLLHTDIKSRAADCLLAGLALYYENFKSEKVHPEVFSTASLLIKHGANYQTVSHQVFQSGPQELAMLGSILQQAAAAQDMATITFEAPEFYDFSQLQARMMVEKLKGLGIQQSVLALWKSHNSAPATKGFFYSPKANLINKLAQHQAATINNGWVFLNLEGQDIKAHQEIITNILR